MTEPTLPPLPLGAVVYEPGFEIEPVLGAARDRLIGRDDIRVGGVVPCYGRLLPNGRHEMALEDIATGTPTTISQDLGAGADSCILDLDGFARSGVAIMRAVEAGVDLVFVGKFGKQEAAGHGLRDEIGRAVLAGIPTVIALRNTQVEAFDAFVGAPYTTLPPDVDAIVGWALETAAARVG